MTPPAPDEPPGDDAPESADGAARAGRTADVEAGPRPRADRARREAEALRRNLARRKAQQRARRDLDES